MDAREIAEGVGLGRRDEDRIYRHLNHVVKTLRAKEGLQLMMEPPRCLSCGYTFTGLTKPRKPKKCPKCRDRRIAPPKFLAKAIKR